MGGGHDTSLKCPNYPKMVNLLDFVLEPCFFAYRLLFGQDEEGEPYFHKFDPIRSCGEGVIPH